MINPLDAMDRERDIVLSITSQAAPPPGQRPIRSHMTVHRTLIPERLGIVVSDDDGGPHRNSAIMLSIEERVALAEVLLGGTGRVIR